MKQMKIIFSFLAISALLLSCAGEDYTDPKPSKKTGNSVVTLFDSTKAPSTLEKAYPSGFCTYVVPATNYFDAFVSNGVIGIKGSGILAQQTSATPLCAANDYCACTELQRLAFTSPTVNNNNLKITAKLSMPNYPSAGTNYVVFQRTFSGDFLPTPGTDIVYYMVGIVRTGDSGCVFINRGINNTDGTNSYGPGCGSGNPLGNVFGATDNETDITIEFIRVDDRKFKIRVAAADTNTGSPIEDEDDPSNNIGTGSGSKITVSGQDIVLGAVVNQIPTTAVGLVLFTNQGTGATNAPFDPAKAPTVANLKITQ